MAHSPLVGLLIYGSILTLVSTFTFFLGYYVGTGEKRR